METFFHARAGSPLLRGITDDDFITWFDKTELASLKTTASIDNICECGRICSRDYEFRKPEDQSERNIEHAEPTTQESSTVEYTEATTGSVKIATNDMTTIGNYISTAEIDKTTNKPTTVEIKNDSKNDVAQTEAVSLLFKDQSSTMPSALETTTILELEIKPEINQDIVTTLPEQTLKAAKKHSDDPIIVPTATYVNQSNDIKVENNIVPMVPKTNGELIVQNGLVPKTVSIKEEIKKKLLPRRKGTLKATYGEKEKIFVKTKAANQTEHIQELHKIIPKVKEILLTKPTEAVKAIEKSRSMKKSTEVDKLDMVNKEITKPSIKSVKESKFAKVEKEKDFKDVAKPNIDKTLKIDDKITKTEYVPIKIVSKIEKTHITHAETSTSPHTIAAITNSNIKNIHYRTKKPKAATQIIKPFLQNTNHSEIKYEEQKNESHITEIKINKTKMKSFNPGKNVAKTVKSINKEIHKLPPTPISETSKTLAGTPKSDIAPENRGGFEILDKNRLWELLKEGSDAEAKLDDKLQVHNRLILAQNTSNENRSL